MAYFAVILAHADGWDATLPIRRQRGWDEHAAFMDALVADGFLVLGGPLGTGEHGQGDTTLHLVRAGDPDEIAARFAADPWARESLLRTESIQPWRLWLGDPARTPAGTG